MINEKILNILNKYYIPLSIIDKYNEPHRFYHNLEHINYMVNYADNPSDKLLLAIIFHDIIYCPKSSTNEEDSVRYASNYINDTDVFDAILDTKTHNPKTELGKQLCELDLMIINSDFKTFIDFEHKIFKEYQWVDYSIYKEKRVEILEKLNVKSEYVDYVRYRKPNIGVYTGSFNPFHIGHYDILSKAEKIFDKVIIARGTNPDKNNTFVDLPDRLKYHQIEVYDGLTTDFIKKLDYDVSLIRGIRNQTDLQFEISQYRYMQDMLPSINVVSIFCDSKYEHISSSGIRTLKKYNVDNNYEI